MWEVTADDLRPIWERVRDYLPKKFTTGARSHYDWNIVDGEDIGLNERFRFYRYEPNDYFAPHYDGCFARNHREQSHYTFIVRLSPVTSP